MCSSDLINKMTDKIKMMYKTGNLFLFSSDIIGSSFILCFIVIIECRGKVCNKISRMMEINEKSLYNTGKIAIYFLYFSFKGNLMFSRSFAKWIYQAILFTIFTLLVFGSLKWFNIDVGTAAVWVSGVIFYWVISGVTILPWNVHFSADDALEGIRIAREKKMTVDEYSEQYARKVRRRSGIVAILLHLMVSLGCLMVALFTSLGTIAYLAAGAALALTFARPAIRSAEHAVRRLQDIQEEARYPRDDVHELKMRLEQLKHFDERATDLQKAFEGQTKEMEKSHHRTLDQVKGLEALLASRTEEMERKLAQTCNYIDQKIASISSATELASAMETFERRGISSITFSDRKEK